MKEDESEIEKPDYNPFFVVGGTLGLVSFVVEILKSFAPGISPVTTYSLGFLVALVALGSVFLAFYINSKTRRFTLYDRDDGGSLLRDDVRRANQSILGTHFTAETPNEGYLTLLRHCLDRQVQITRLVYFHPHVAKEEYDWLDRFTKGTLHPHCYEQVELSCWLPFNIVIFDGRIVWLFFPGHERDYYRNALRICNRDVAGKFTNAFFSLRKHQQKGTTSPPPTTGLEHSASEPHPK